MQPKDELTRREYLTVTGGTLSAGIATAAALAPASAAAQQTGNASAESLTEDQLRAGAALLTRDRPRDEDPQAVVARYDGLRVSDVLDALQALGLQDVGIMDHEIRPLWRDHTQELAHRFYGVAVTYQYVPTNKAPAARMPYEEFRKWHSSWYREKAPELFRRIIRPGTVIVIDAHGINNTGFIGSNNALAWKSLGMTGVVTNGGCRDTDELILERVPVYSRYQGGGTRPGRIEAAAINRPVSVGGVLVHPGDVVVADGDGVVVVPRAHDEQVAKIAWDIADSDKQGRRKLYEETGLSPDATVK